MTHRVLIVGLGMAGMASAIALKQKGWTPIIVEKSAERRTGGYFIGLHGAGKDAAEKLGILIKFMVAPQHNRKTGMFWTMVVGFGLQVLPIR